MRKAAAAGSKVSKSTSGGCYFCDRAFSYERIIQLTGGVLLTFVELVHGSVAIPIVSVVVPVVVSTAVCPSTTSDVSSWIVYHV